MNTNQLTENTLSDMNQNLKPKDDIEIRLNSGNISSDKEISKTRSESRLRQRLRTFTESDEDDDVIKSNLNEVRKIYKPRTKFPQNLTVKHFIFNSVYNRNPNFRIEKVLKEKLKYAFRIGGGLASYNFLPLSWITDTFWQSRNFLMKDRGHITTLICHMYEEEFKALLVVNILKELISEHKAVDNWSEDNRIAPAVKCWQEMFNYLDTNMNSNFGKKKDHTTSLRDLADAVTFFGEKLNYTPISIEVRKESVWVHAKEILNINNIHNAWIDFQHSFLDWMANTMKKDGSDNYFRNVLNIEKVRVAIDELIGFQSAPKTTIRPMLTAINNYKAKVSQWSDIIPLKLLGIRMYEKDYDKRGGDSYGLSEEKNITPVLQSISDNKLEEKDAIKTLKLADVILTRPAWADYHTENRKKVKELKGGISDVKKLEDASLLKEDFGLACLDSVIELSALVPGMKNRKNDELVTQLVRRFVDALIKEMNNVIENDKIFIEKKTFKSRFKLIIKPAFKTVKSHYQSNKKTPKAELFETQLELVQQITKPSGQSKFAILQEKDDFNCPDVTYIDFDATPKESGFDLGRKNHADGYTPENVVLQVKRHNRQQFGDLNTEKDWNTLNYMEWFSVKNWELKEKHFNRLIEKGEFQAIADADKLKELFDTKG